MEQANVGAVDVVEQGVELVHDTGSGNGVPERRRGDGESVGHIEATLGQFLIELAERCILATNKWYIINSELVEETDMSELRRGRTGHGLILRQMRRCWGGSKGLAGGVSGRRDNDQRTRRITKSVVGNGSNDTCDRSGLAVFTQDHQVVVETRIDQNVQC